MNYKEINCCRICGNKNLIDVLDLGVMALTGHFLEKNYNDITEGPIILSKCIERNEKHCGLLQLKHTYDLTELYSYNYGYRSGLNTSMVAHLKNNIKNIEKNIKLQPGDVVLDIGSNDGTTLRQYVTKDILKIGIDPTANKFRRFYDDTSILIPDFFTKNIFEENFKEKKCKVVTSFSMFYDLEDPMSFMSDIFDILEISGIWVFEQSYLPDMLKKNAFDTICHEHLEYYALKQILWLANKVGFSLIDVDFDYTNGGSFRITAQKNLEVRHADVIQQVIEAEEKTGINDLTAFTFFQQKIDKTKKDFWEFVEDAIGNGKKICALGASTKGNVLLQYFGINSDVIEQIGEVNEEKFNTFTPGTHIRIIDQSELLSQHYDYFVVLPWHFREFFINNPIFVGKKLVFLLPELEIVSL